jgi:predicted phosphodiesterase
MLEELLAQPDNYKQPKTPKNNFNYTTEYLPHDPNSQIIQATTSEDLRGKGDKAIEQFIVSQGGVVPAGYRARLVEIRHQTHGWTRKQQDEDAVTKPTFFYKFLVEPIAGHINADEIIAWIGKKKPATPAKPASPNKVQHFGFSDMQLGKVDSNNETGDGVEQTVAKFVDSLDKAVQRWKKEGKPAVHLIFAGDCIEGFGTSQNGKLVWRQSLTVTEQMRIFRRLIILAIDAFVSLGAHKVEVDVVNGNHDQATRQVETKPNDGWATESAIAVKDALDLNPERYNNVSIFVPKNDDDIIVRQVGTVTMAIAHGHQWARGKSMDWLAGQALNQQPAGQADILFHGHEHEFSVKTRKTRWAICGAPLEVRSNWWKMKTGDEAKRGAIVFVSDHGEIEGLTIV